MESHISRAFDEEIDHLEGQITAMGSVCETQLARAVAAFRDSDHTLARKVVETDKKLNRMNARLAEEAVAVMARRTPKAGDLRYFIAVMKIATELERIGDYAANIAKRALALKFNQFDRPADLILEMAKTCGWMIRNAMSAFSGMDADRAEAVWRRDDEIDEKFSLMISALKEAVADRKILVESYADMVFIGRSCERIGDHVTNIAEGVNYIRTGESEFTPA